MSYKYRSLLYLFCFVVSALAYNNLETNSESESTIALESTKILQNPIEESSASNSFEDEELKEMLP